MQTTTLEIVKAGLRGDPSLTPQARDKILEALKAATSPYPVPEQETCRVLRRIEVARRLSVSLRTVDKLHQQGVLRKIQFPHRNRAAGFRQSDVQALIEGACDSR